MSEGATRLGPGDGSGPAQTADLSTAELIGRLSQQTSTLVQDEIQLAKVEIQASVKDAAVGGGLFGVAGITALYGIGVLIATLILVLATFLDAWLAALIVGLLLMAVAGLAAVMGKKKVEDAAEDPMAATKANVRRDADTVKEARS